MDYIKRLLRSYFTKSVLPYWCILCLDCTIAFTIGIICHYLIDGGNLFINRFWPLVNGTIVSVGILAIFYKLFHTYVGVIRFSTFIDLQRVGTANLCASAIVMILQEAQEATGLCTGNCLLPRTLVILLAFFITTFLQIAIRTLVKICHDTVRTDSAKQKVFIYGCMQGGVALGLGIRNNPDTLFNVRGFISTDSTIAKSWMMGVKVYYDTDEVVQIMLKYGVRHLLISPIQVDHFRERESLIQALIKNRIRILMMPPAIAWDGKSPLNANQLKEVEIEDLLPRDQIQVDLDAIAQQLKDRCILITGAAGSIGSEMVRQVAQFHPARMVLIDQAETPMHDIRLMMAHDYPQIQSHTIVSSIGRKERMEEIFAQYRPEYVFHAAAYKHVPMMEDNPKEAVQNNIYGTRVIADLAVKYGTRKFVMISTDKAVNPTNVMGCSKRICEIYCQSLNKAIQDAKSNAEGSCQFITTRFGNVLGSNGSVIPLFRKQIREGGPLTVTHKDIIRYFMLIPEACKLVLEAGTMGHGGEIFVFDMGKPVRIADLAQRMIDLSGATDIQIQYTGLRHGEKLFEELLADQENTKPSAHPKIKVADVRPVEYAQALAQEEELYRLSFTGTDMDVVRMMKQIVPEFKSRQSIYEILDK